VHRIASLLTSSLPNKQTGTVQGLKPRARLSLSCWPASLGFAPLSPQDAYAKAVADADQAAVEAAAAAAQEASTGGASSGRSGKSNSRKSSSNSGGSGGGSSSSKAASSSSSSSSRSAPFKPAQAPLLGCVDIKGVLRCWDTRTWDLAACADVSRRPFRPDRHHTGSGSGEGSSSSAYGNVGSSNTKNNKNSNGGGDSSTGGGGASLHWMGPRRACVGDLLGGSISVLDVVSAEAVTDARELARDAVRVPQYSSCFSLFYFVFKRK